MSIVHPNGLSLPQIGSMSQAARLLALQEPWFLADVLNSYGVTANANAATATAYTPNFAMTGRNILRLQANSVANSASVLIEATLGGLAANGEPAGPWTTLSTLSADGIVVLDGWYAFVRVYYAVAPTTGPTPTITLVAARSAAGI